MARYRYYPRRAAVELPDLDEVAAAFEKLNSVRRVIRTSSSGGVVKVLVEFKQSMAPHYAESLGRGIAARLGLRVTGTSYARGQMWDRMSYTLRP